MAVSKVETRGRPFYVADLPGISKTSSRIYDDFCEVMRNINYREIAALARSLGMARGSVSNWKYCGYSPSRICWTAHKLSIHAWHRRPLSDVRRGIEKVQMTSNC